MAEKTDEEFYRTVNQMIETHKKTLAVEANMRGISVDDVFNERMNRVRRDLNLWPYNMKQEVAR